jgi:ABC-type sugar transport system ATPase subunit
VSGEVTSLGSREAESAAVSDDEPLLRAIAIHKHFGGVTALDGAHLELRRGEIMGLVGDNGAGKTTLVQIVAGSLEADSGQVLVEGREVHFRGPAEALNAGIETVYQDLALVDPLSAVGNIFLGREVLRRSAVGRALRLMDSRSMRVRARAVIDEIGAHIPSISAPARDLSGGQRQSLAIARAMLFRRRIVILDEPTAALGVRESEHVLEIIRRLKAGGCSVIVISHNVEQLMRYADRVTVLRLGRTVGVRAIAMTAAAEIVSLITGVTGPDGSSTAGTGSEEPGRRRHE